MTYNIREIEEKDNKEIEKVIRLCLIEFGANHEGTAWADPNLGRFSEVYNTEGNKYWVAEDENGNQKTTCNITLYQDEHDAIVRVKSDDLSVYEKLSADFDKGSLITLKVKVNAYQNNAYYKLIELVS